MKNRQILLVAAILSAFCIASCVKDDGYLYHNLTEFGVVENGSIRSDEGVLLSVADNQCEKKLDTMYRVLYVCDVTKQLTDNTYEIILKDIVSVKVLNTVLQGSPAASERVYDDPVYISSAWMGGGFMNLAVSFYVKSESETPHSFLLVEDTPVFDEDYQKEIDINLRLYHEGGGESYVDPEVEMTELKLVNTYLSIPIEQLDPYHGGKPENGMLLRLGRLWHAYETDIITRETKMYYSYGTFNEEK